MRDTPPPEVSFTLTNLEMFGTERDGALDEWRRYFQAASVTISPTSKAAAGISHRRTAGRRTALPPERLREDDWPERMSCAWNSISCLKLCRSMCKSLVV